MHPRPRRRAGFSPVGGADATLAEPDAQLTVGAFEGRNSAGTALTRAGARLIAMTLIILAIGLITTVGGDAL